MIGDYNGYSRKAFADKTLDRQILAADDTTALNNIIVPKSAHHQLILQRITFYETTESNGKTLTFQDDSSTPIVVGKYFSTTAAAGIPKSLVLEFGPKGYALGVGKNLDVVVSSAGIAGALHVECYEKLGDSLTNFNTSVNSDGNVVAATTKTSTANA